MRRTLLLLTLVAAVLLACTGVVLAQPQTPQQKIPDTYIVVFKDGVQNPAAVANEHVRAYDLQPRFVYRHAIEGYAAVFPNDRALRRVQSDGRVAYVEPDGVARAVAPPWEREESTATGQTLPWGIDLVDADISSTKAGDESGAVSGVNAYIIDTGVDMNHSDLNVVNHVNYASGPNKDCHGHGTHVTGTVAAKDNTQDVVGVAPGVPLTGVKVLSCSGSGTWSGVIAGIDWVTANATKPAIANMSLGGGANDAVDDAVKKSAASGVFYSIAAGNDGKPACNYSPARAGLADTDTNGDGKINHDDSNGIVTTAATDSNDEDPSWSNYGKCVDIWAPGVNILSTKNGGGTTTMSGTSMAAPHVGGGGALYLSTYTSTSPLDVEKALKENAKDTGNISNSDNPDRPITRLDVGSF